MPEQNLENNVDIADRIAQRRRVAPRDEKLIEHRNNVESVNQIGVKSSVESDLFEEEAYKFTQVKIKSPIYTQLFMRGKQVRYTLETYIEACFTVLQKYPDIVREIEIQARIRHRQRKHQGRIQAAKTYLQRNS